MPLHDTSPGYLPGQEIGYAQITSNVNIASTTEATGTTIISPGAIAFDGGLVIVEFFAPSLKADSGGTGNFSIVSLFEGATQITRLCLAEELATFSTDNYTVNGRYRFTPTAGLHTYTITAFASSTSGTPAVVAGSGGTAGYPPAFVRFTKV